MDVYYQRTMTPGWRFSGVKTFTSSDHEFLSPLTSTT